MIHAAAVFVSVVAAVPSAGTAPHFTVDEVAPGVYAVVSNDPLGLANHSNAAFIVGDDDVVVVDSQFTLERTREVLAALRKITDKPVRTLVNTHWHDDHTFGNQVYAEAFPNLEIIAQTHTKSDMGTVGVKNRAGQVAGGPDAIAMFREAIDKKTCLDGTPMSEDERAAYESTIAIAQEYLDDMPDFHLTLPTKTFDDRTTIEQGGRTIEIRWFGPAVTGGDAAVYLPRERVLIAGDLVDNPFPFTYGCDVAGWIAALDSIRALQPRVIVPGHGDVIDDGGPIDRLQSALQEIRKEAAAAAAGGETLEQARAEITLSDLRSQMAGGNEMLRFLFDGYFVKPAVASAFQAALKKESAVR